MFTPNQVQELKRVMDKYTVTFIAHHIGKQILSEDEIKLLVSTGFPLKDIVDSTSNIEQAFKFGLLSDALGHEVAKKMNYAQFLTYMTSGKFIPLNPRENAAIHILRMQTAASVRHQAANMKSDLEQSLVAIEKGKQPIHSKKVLTLAEQVILDRKGVTELRSLLGKETQQWDRNMGRMAHYVLHDAFNQGRVSNIERKGGESKIYFDVFEGSCKYCIQLYLTGGAGSEPKAFTIDELRANGSNVGRKAIEWKATIGPVHPNCRCTANEVPVGYEWNQASRAFDKPVEFERKVQRRSKVKITVNGKTTEI